MEKYVHNFNKKKTPKKAERLWRSIATCGGYTSVEYFKSKKEANTAKDDIDHFGCGGKCPISSGAYKANHFIRPPVNVVGETRSEMGHN